MPENSGTALAFANVVPFDRLAATVRPNIIPRLAGLLALAGTLICTPIASGDVWQGKGKPKAALRVNPTLIFVPQRIVATAELTEGADDYREYYCPRIEWEWGDDTTSESVEDCEPYQAGVSKIRRRYTADKTYRYTGVYDVIFRMKQGTKTVLTMRQQIRAQGQ